MQRRTLHILASTLAAVTVVGSTLVACSNDDNTTPAPAAVVSDGAGDAYCLEPIPSDERQKLQNYMVENSDELKATGQNGDGTQNVCLLEPDGQGGYEQHYYSPGDGLSDYPLYALLWGRSNTLMAYTLVEDSNGSFDFGDYLLLHLLLDIDDDGRAYRPYVRDGNGQWHRGHTAASNYHVSRVRFGKSAAIDFKTAKGQFPPAGYTKSTLAKPQPDSRIRRGGFGIPGATPGTQQRTTGATQPVTTSAKAATTAARPATTVAKPATTAAKSTATTNQLPKTVRNPPAPIKAPCVPTKTRKC